MDDGLIRLGVIGCGGFGLFALQQFTQVPGVRLVGMAGTHRPASLAAAARFGVENVDDLGAFLGRDDVDVVYIATPPFLHHRAGDGRPGGRQARDRREAAGPDRRPGRRADRRRPAAGPAAGRQPDAAVQPAVRRRAPAGRGPGARARCSTGRSRTTPRTRTCRPSTGSGTGPRAAASSSSTGSTSSTSSPAGSGRGRVEAAQVGVRPGTAIEEHVHCTVRYGDTALVNFYHGFHQAGRMDRQELRLVFERGDVTLYDWVPTRARIHAVVDERQTRDLCDLFPGARLDVDRLLRRQGPRPAGAGARRSTPTR